MSDFVSLPLFGFTFSYKAEKFGFWKSLKYVNIFYPKNDVKFEYFLANSVWLGWSFIVWAQFWAISWEIRILNLTETVLIFFN